MSGRAQETGGSEALYLYAIVPVDDDCGDIMGAARDLPNGIQLIGKGKWAAAVGDSAEGDLRGRDRRELARLLLAHQKVVERIMAVLPVLPVKFGTLAPDRASVERCLEGGSGEFAAAFESLKGKAQFEILATWDLDTVFAEIATDPAVMRLKAELVAAAGNPDREAAARLGRLVKRNLERRRGELGETLSGALRQAATDGVASPLMDDRMVLNLALLVDADRTDALDRCLEAVDAAHEGRLNFRCVGPLPPYSFAMVEITFLDDEEIARARNVLQLESVRSREQVRAAYRRLAKKAHPDAAADRTHGDDMTALHDAYKTLASFADAGGPVMVSVRRQEAAGAGVGGRS